MRSAWREKYAWGPISPTNVIRIVENRNAATPVMIDAARRARSVLMATFPQRIVVRRKLESRRSSRTRAAARLPIWLSTSRRRRVTPKTARFRPENMADCDRHKAMPTQVRPSIS